MMEAAWPSCSSEPTVTACRVWLLSSVVEKEGNLYPVNCSPYHSELNWIQTNMLFSTIVKNRVLCMTEPKKFVESPAAGPRAWSLEQYRLRRLEPWLSVTEYLVMLSIVVPWKAQQVPTETFNTRKHSDADGHGLLFATFSGLQKK